MAPSRSRHFALSALSALALAAPLALIAGAPASAAGPTLVVNASTTSAVPQPGELGWAIEQANAVTGAATIDIQVDDILLGADLPTITDGVEIRGNGVTIDGDGWFRTGFFFQDAGGALRDATLTGISGSPLAVSLAAGQSFALENVDAATPSAPAVSLYVVPGSEVLVDGGRFHDSSVGISVSGDGGSVEIEDASISDSTSAGLSIDNTFGALSVVVRDTTIEGSGAHAVSGSLYDTSSLELVDSRVSDADGWGLRLDAFSGSTVSVIRTTLADNSYGGISGFGNAFELVDSAISGGTIAGIEMDSVALTLTRSTVSGIEGPGVQTQVAERLEVVNSTLSGNSGSGINAFVGTTARVSVEHSTVTANDGVGILVDGDAGGDDELRISHSIVAGNALGGGGAADIYVSDTDTAVAWSVIGSSRIIGAAIDGDPASWGVADPGLEPLADNGGPTLTHALADGSPAIDAGDPAIVSAPSTDQRGGLYLRVYDGVIDIGAVEMQPTPVTPAEPADPSDGGDAAPAELADTGADPVLVAGVITALLLVGAVLVSVRRRPRRS
ncbi:right-handed parallel beta-helix repeat-containing protein [Homoserinibacter sp. GY 40078]|uniref:right-handed parallel beta-helix repeat-containing protein n=1 Tax=Homoserinibacter sp. GY 40078 TaxID=2603275 RepID=UPI0011CA7A56|nr:right-handed parallel beta-helix repeat-containing protein [Homoserinibacter sp. GY 40078]TXK18552.1 hypothetical protein FVQ89_00935 [Homoserinibacter sp. GY 40078]